MSSHINIEGELFLYLIRCYKSASCIFIYLDSYRDKMYIFFVNLGFKLSICLSSKTIQYFCVIGNKRTSILTLLLIFTSMKFLYFGIVISFSVDARSGETALALFHNSRLLLLFADCTLIKSIKLSKKCLG